MVADSKSVVSDNPLLSGHVIWRMRIASFAIMKTALQYLSRYASDFDEIWDADANFDSEDGHATKNQNFTNPRRLMPNLEGQSKIARRQWPRDQNCKVRKFKMAVGNVLLSNISFYNICG